MNKIVTILILTIALCGKIYACLNGESKVLKNGTYLFEDREGNVPYGHSFFTDGFEDGIRQLDSLYKVTNDLDYLSDKGLLLILLHRFDEAITLYLGIEKIQPDRYSTASNIGTAYELMGQNEKALKWIKKSFEIDPKSHMNSEWIHVRILEAKIKGKQFYTTTFLLSTEFGTDVKPNSEMSNKELQNLSDAIYYQLNERVSFVKPKEPIVAQLYFDLGNIAFLVGNYEDALRDYAEAKEYGFTNPLIEIRTKEANQLSKQTKSVSKVSVKNSLQSNYLTYGLWILGVSLLTILITIIYKHKKKPLT